MARLRHLASDTVWPVAARALVGRSAACALRLDAAHASKEHCVLEWLHGRWAVRDLGSRNGTFVNGHRLDAGVVGPVALGDRLAFGDVDDVWRLDDDGAPEPMAIDLATREIREGQGCLLALPSDRSPELVVVQRPDGRWTVERGEGGEEASAGAGGEGDEAIDRTTVSVGGRSWCLLLPGPAEATPQLPTALSVESVRFRFGVSRDEEHVRLALLGPHHQAAVEAREFNYVLLTLARQRLADAARPVAERGWLDRERLLEMLRMQPSALNVAIHRARQQLHAAGLQGASAVVEVRRGARRFGSDRIEIVGLSDL